MRISFNWEVKTVEECRDECNNNANCEYFIFISDLDDAPCSILGPRRHDVPDPDQKKNSVGYGSRFCRFPGKIWLYYKLTAHFILAFLDE